MSVGSVLVVADESYVASWMTGEGRTWGGRQGSKEAIIIGCPLTLLITPLTTLSCGAVLHKNLTAHSHMVPFSSMGL